MHFDAYDLNAAIYDEMFLPDGTPREHCRELYDTLCRLSDEEIGAIQERVTHSFSTEGITFTVYGDDEADERIIPIDCVPRLLSAAEWRHLESGLTQRIGALNRFLEDVYSEARIIADGVIPADVVRGCPQYRIEMRGVSVPHGTWVAVCGTDLVGTQDDGFLVLEDNLRVPSGVSYMIANRKVVKTSLRRLYRSCRVREVEHYGQVLLQTLRDLAPGGRTDPCIVLLTPGVYNSAFYEHMFLAHEIGAALVEGRDLLVNDGFVYMRTTTGLRRVDVIYRRVDDDFLDPLVFRPDSLLGVPGLLHAFKLGNVALANAPGTGVADDKSVYAYVPDMIRSRRESCADWDFAHPSALVRPSPALAAFVDRHRIEPVDDPLESLLQLSHTLHHCLQYIPGSTSAESPVEHILETGRGVCQDYAHLMIAIARSWGIPTRYVSGYLNPDEQTPSNATHAWVECRLPGLGWVGFDPTNQSFAGEGGKVHIAVGRDYRDVSPTRGVLQGGGETRLEVDVRTRSFPIESP